MPTYTTKDYPPVLAAARALDEFRARNPEFAAFLDTSHTGGREAFSAALHAHPDAVIDEWERLHQALVKAKVEALKAWHAGHVTPHRLCYACRRESGHNTSKEA